MFLFPIKVNLRGLLLDFLLLFYLYIYHIKFGNCLHIVNIKINPKGTRSSTPVITKSPCNSMPLAPPGPISISCVFSTILTNGKDATKDSEVDSPGPWRLSNALCYHDRK